MLLVLLLEFKLLDSGTEYSQSSPPTCLIQPPKAVSESDEVGSYFGDDGIIVGFGTEGGAADVDKSLIFDIHIPYGSFHEKFNYCWNCCYFKWYWYW